MEELEKTIKKQQIQHMDYGHMVTQEYVLTKFSLVTTSRNQRANKSEMYRTIITDGNKLEAMRCKMCFAPWLQQIINSHTDKTKCSEAKEEQLKMKNIKSDQN